MEMCFVVTYGRSGSTLLQGILNQLPHTLIRGENNLFLLPLGRSFKRLSEAHFKMGDGDTRNPWFGSKSLSPIDFLNSMSRIVESQLLGSYTVSEISRLGFKEIRYIELSQPELFDHLNFLRSLFPSHQFIFHTRNHQQVAESGWWAQQDSDKVMERLQVFENHLVEFSMQLPPKSYLWTSYEAIVEGRESFRKILNDFFGSEIRRENFEWVLEQTHSSRTEDTSG
jgi:hypothetical protein